MTNHITIFLKVHCEASGNSYPRSWISSQESELKQIRKGRNGVLQLEKESSSIHMVCLHISMRKYIFSPQQTKNEQKNTFNTEVLFRISNPRL